MKYAYLYFDSDITDYNLFRNKMYENNSKHNERGGGIKRHYLECVGFIFSPHFI